MEVVHKMHVTLPNAASASNLENRKVGVKMGTLEWDAIAVSSHATKYDAECRIWELESGDRLGGKDGMGAG